MAGAAFQMLMATVTPAATVTQTDFDKNDSSLTTYTFTSKTIGAADPSRYVVVAVGSPANSSNRTISSVTLGGVTMTQVASSFLSAAGGGAFAETALYILQVPVGTTGTVVVTWSGAADRMAIGVFALYNLQSATPTSTPSTSSANPATASINVVAGGVVVAATFAFAGGAFTHTWAGLTKNYDQAFVATNLEHSGASAAFVAAQTGLTVTATPSTTPSAIAMTVAAFR